MKDILSMSAASVLTIKPNKKMNYNVLNKHPRLVLNLCNQILKKI
jgi:hypothetical protein